MSASTLPERNYNVFLEYIILETQNLQNKNAEQEEKDMVKGHGLVK
jgi:hypothetical protein